MQIFGSNLRVGNWYEWGEFGRLYRILVSSIDDRRRVSVEYYYQEPAPTQCWRGPYKYKTRLAEKNYINRAKLLSEDEVALFVLSIL